MSTVRNAHVLALLGKERLRLLQARSNRHGLLFLAGHAAATAATGGLLWLALGAGALWSIPATVLHGIVLVHWFAPCHECMHGTAFRSVWLNTALGWLAGLIILLNPLYFKYEHIAHHAYTSDVEKDPERIAQGETLWGYLYYATAVPYFIGLVSALVRIPLGRFSAEERRFIPRRRLAEVRRAGWIMWAVYGLLIAASVWLQSWAAVSFWLLPRVVGEPFMRLIRMSEHVGCDQTPDMLRNTRTVLTGAPLRLLAWNMCYHAEHHALPQAPFYALPGVHSLVADRLGYLSRGYARTQRELIRNGRSNSA